ncbi:MAG: glycosyltransferase family 2 protein [Elusimicrobiota bacterium]|nr:glycosyltransferase family 2 protein [Elusimicrobiota bacterium]
MDISVVIPVYNEAENLPVLLNEINNSLSASSYDYEIIFIDDGSTDGSSKKLDELKKKENRVNVFHFKRNCGQTAALQKGFDMACGKLTVTLDGDLQNNPADIPAMIELLKDKGADVVSGWRHRRKDSFARRIVSRTANSLISKIVGLKLHDYGCTLKVYRTGFVKDLKLFGEMHRFIPAFVHFNGGDILEMKVSHRRRSRGKSSYGMGRIHRVILDLITAKFLTAYATKPIHVFGSLGLASIALGIISAVFVIIRRLYMGGEWISPLFFIAVFLLGIGLIMILLGIIAEIAVRIYFSHENEN